jgi:hypothetical protein
LNLGVISRETQLVEEYDASLIFQKGDAMYESDGVEGGMIWGGALRKGDRGDKRKEGRMR